MTADDTVWKQVEGDHADDPTYEHQHLNPNDTPTDEKRTQEDIERDEQQNKENEQKRGAANKAAKENS